MQVNFGKENRFHLYHSEGGERFMTNCTRLNMLFLAGNSILLLLEIVSPCKNCVGINRNSLRVLAWRLSEHDPVLLGHGLLDAPPLLNKDDPGPLPDAGWPDNGGHFLQRLLGKFLLKDNIPVCACRFRRRRSCEFPISVISHRAVSITWSKPCICTIRSCT
jgi:hypothetical protein